MAEAGRLAAKDEPASVDLPTASKNRTHRSDQFAWELPTWSPSSGSSRLEVGSHDDPLEHAADRGVESVLAPSTPDAVPLGDLAAGRDRGSPARRRSTGLSSGMDGREPLVAAALRRGRPLSDGERADMEPRFGVDLGGVRIHDDATAHDAARSLGAQAFTLGSDVVLRSGAYTPGSTSGRRLLAHELTHVVQQRAVPTTTAAPATATAGTRAAARVGTRAGAGGAAVIRRTIGDGHDLRSNRFAGVTELEAAYDGETTIGAGATGLHVTIVQQALDDAGHTIAAPGINGDFHAGTTAAVRAFQTAKGLTGAAVTGVIDATTMDLLDQHFMRHASERSIARDPYRSALEGTRAVTATESAGVTRAITTEPRTATGALPTFTRDLPAGRYDVRIRARLNAAITSQYARMVTSRPTRAPGNIIPDAEINRIANRARLVVDSVFGHYRTGAAMTFGTNIRDRYEVIGARIAASSAVADAAAAWRVDKLLSGDDAIKAIDREHGAVQSRAAEAALIAPIRTAVIAARRAELLEIHRNWPASAEHPIVLIQRLRGSTDAENRDILWLLFATMIHEYIHNLEHPNHVTFRNSLPQQRGGFVLREGMTDYFARVVWDGINFSASLRAFIEGPYHDAANPMAHPIPNPPRYSEWRNAERAVGIVGIRNAMAAFFHGRTEFLRLP